MHRRKKTISPGVARLVRRLNERRIKAGHRSFSSREELVLAEAAHMVVDWLRSYNGQLAPDARHQVRLAAQRLYRDEWYQLDSQLLYFNELRAECVRARIRSAPLTHRFFNDLTVVAADACRATHRYEWPLLILVGFGALARTKLAAPLAAFHGHLPFDLWIVEPREAGRDDARQVFASHPTVRILHPSEAPASLDAYRNHFRTSPIVVYVATATDTHASVVDEWASRKVDVIAVEKPLYRDPKDAARFRQLAEDERRTTPSIVVVDHYGFKRAPLLIEEAKRKYPIYFNDVLARATTLRFVMHETQPVDPARGAKDEGVILDMMPHLFPFVAVLVTRKLDDLVIDRVDAWRHENAPGAAETYATVQFHLADREGFVLRASVGKGCASNEKRVDLEGPDAALSVDLNTGDVAVHAGLLNGTLGDSQSRELDYGAVIDALLGAPALSFQSLDTGIAVVDRLLAVQTAANARGTYPLGTTPRLKEK